MFRLVLFSVGMLISIERYVRVHFHSHLYQIYDRSPPDLTADVPLCRSGGLDLDVVKRRWGLETCLVNMCQLNAH
jgi:hypothetical protein